MTNAVLDELQARIKIADTNINNLRYMDDATLMAESKEELKNLLMKMKEESKRANLKLNKGKKIKKKKLRSWHLVPSTAATAAKSLQLCLTLCDPIDSSPPGCPSLGFSRQEHWSGLPFPSPMHESEK